MPVLLSAWERGDVGPNLKQVIHWRWTLYNSTCKNPFNTFTFWQYHRWYLDWRHLPSMANRMTFVCAHILWEEKCLWNEQEHLIQKSRKFRLFWKMKMLVTRGEKSWKIDLKSDRNVSNLPDKPKSPLSSSTLATVVVCLFFFFWVFLQSGVKKKNGRE